MKQFHLIIILSFITALFGCTKEDLSNCQTIHYLTFEYSKNKQGIDLFPSQVKTLDVYAFDMNGKYLKHFSDEGSHLSTTSYSMPIDLPEGEYTLVVWGGAKNDYIISEKNNYGEQSLQPAISRFDYSILTLKKTTTANKEFPEDLFYGIAKQITVDSKKSRQTPIKLTKNTNTINITVNGLQNINKSTNHNHIDIICAIANSELKFDNSISLPERLINYTPNDRVDMENVLAFKIKTLRLLTGMKSDLIIRNSITREQIFNGNLIELLLQSPNIQNNEDLDINDEYHINISINVNLSISVSVNGYIILDSDQEIQ